jgi:hypothetical protein
LLGVALWMGQVSVFSQILDDSTKLVYGAFSTRYRYGEDVLYSRSQEQKVDTSFLNFHNYYFYYRDGMLYQDLGNLGTALRQVYYTPASSPGRTLGHQVFQPYMVDPERIPLYNTRSPFMRLAYIQGSRGLQSINAEFSRNIKPHWNAGFNIRRMVALKQIGVSDRTEQQFNNYGFQAQTNYTAPSGKYAAYAWMNVMHHFHFETGGILPDSGDTQELLFDYKLENVRLNKSSGTKARLQSEDRRTYYRLYQQASIASKRLMAFHQLDFQKQIIRYQDNNLSQNSSYYPAILLDSSSADDWTNYHVLENKAGLKFAAGKWYANAYVRHRKLFFKQDEVQMILKEYQELLGGGVLEFRMQDTLTAGIQVEQGSRDYLHRVYAHTKWLNLEASVRSLSPTLLQENMSSNFASWNYSWANSQTFQGKAEGILAFKDQYIKPGISFTSVNKLIYYDSTGTPNQSDKNIGWASVSLRLKNGYRWIWMENDLIYTQRSGPEYWPVPQWFYMGRIYTQGQAFKKVLKLQVGIEAFFTSSYAAPSYSTSIQQFYITPSSDSLARINDALQANFFMNAYLKRAKFFFLVSHANQNLPQAGFFKTPYYSALARTIQFGVTWMFYD